jgi:adenylate kinase family enzyme
MRGIPGSGKSTTAKKLAGETGKIHSTDNYFMVDGEYKFDPSKIREYHEANF